uniref:Uncharacterized protein n=1 Tax=Populus trichocarpa TaxID=3694 RepID=A0A3N7EJT2_POPTR
MERNLILHLSHNLSLIKNGILEKCKTVSLINQLFSLINKLNMHPSPCKNRKLQLITNLL